MTSSQHRKKHRNGANIQDDIDVAFSDNRTKSDDTSSQSEEARELTFSTALFNRAFFFELPRHHPRPRPSSLFHQNHHYGSITFAVHLTIKAKQLRQNQNGCKYLVIVESLVE